MDEKILLKNVHTVVTCDDDDKILNDVDILMENGIIKEISPSIDVKCQNTIDGKDLIVYPGLINTHHHLYQILTRSLPQVQNLELFDWLKVLYDIWKNIDGEDLYKASLSGLSEMAKFGTTTVFDHHYVFPKGKNDFIQRKIDAAEKVGVRVVLSRGSMDLSKKDGGLPPDSVVQSIDEIMKDSEDLINKYHDSKRYSMKQIVLAPCSPFSVSRDLMKETQKLARKHKVRLHTHLAETLDEEKYIRQRYKVRPLKYMEELEWVGEDVWYAHGIHFNDDELRFLAKTKTGVAHCPISNMKLSSGVANIPRMLELKVPVGLAVDGSASNDGSSLLEEMRVCYLLHRLTFADKAPSGYDILKMATRGSASILGRDDIGCIKKDMAADIFAIDKNRIELSGATFDVKNMLCTVGLKGAVDYTFINGKMVVNKGKVVNVDERKVALDVYNSSKKLQKMI